MYRGRRTGKRRGIGQGKMRNGRGREGRRGNEESLRRLRRGRRRRSWELVHRDALEGKDRQIACDKHVHKIQEQIN